MIKKTFYIAMLFLLIYFSFSCFLQKDRDVNLKESANNIRPCDSINILENLVQEVVMYKGMYARVPFITDNIDYILIKGIELNKKVYRSPYKDKAIYVTESELRNAKTQGGTIDIYDITFDKDSTIADLKTTYYLLLKENAASTNSLRYNFDTTTCQWKLIDSSKVYN